MPTQPVEATQHHRCVLTLARLPSVMVDLRTAMAAAQAEQKRRQDRNPRSPEKKKNRSGADLGIDPFDPVKYVNKERADTASMWLVIVYSLVVTCLMRFVLMPTTTLDKTDVLYLLPLMMMILIPQIHRSVMPERFKEHYTKGTWFKAFFLYTFTFLSFSFLLVNPPFGDIVAPQLADEWGVAIETENGFLFADENRSNMVTWTLDDSGSVQGDAWLLFGLADNVGANEADVEVRYTFLTETVILSSNSTFWAEHDSDVGGWRTQDNSTAPILLPHPDQDQAMAIYLGDSLSAGEHNIDVTITEDGNPWENTRSYSWTLLVIQG